MPTCIAPVAATEAGFSEVWVEEGGLLGRVVLRDDIRPQAASVVEELRKRRLADGGFDRRPARRPPNICGPN